MRICCGYLVYVCFTQCARVPFTNVLDKRYHVVLSDQYEHVVPDERPSAPSVDDVQCVPNVDGVQYEPNDDRSEHDDDVGNAPLHS